jgi:hypothetical protein
MILIAILSRTIKFQVLGVPAAGHQPTQAHDAPEQIAIKRGKIRYQIVDFYPFFT